MSTQQTSTQLVPGPLYPDLFDGETPVMVPPESPLQAYAVEVSYIRHSCRLKYLTVAAPSEDDACAIALALAKREADENEDDHAIDAVEELEWCEPEREQVLQWHEYSEANHV